MRRGTKFKRRRSLLESPWLIPGLAAVAVAGWFGSDIVASGFARFGLVADAGAQRTFRKCWTSLESNCVVDGDTIRLHGVKVRLLDIDAPETRDYKCASEKQLGDRATRRLQEVLSSGSVTLVRQGRDEDRYGRKLRVVMVDGRSAGQVLVAEGLARRWSGKRRPWCL